MRKKKPDSKSKTASIPTRQNQQVEHNTPRSHISVDVNALSPEEMKQLIHDLQVQQIELEQQNEALRQTQQKISDVQASYAELCEFAPIGYLTLNDQSIIQTANQTSAALFNVEKSHLHQKPFPHFVAKESQNAFYLYQQRVLGNQTEQVCELILVRENEGVFNGRLQSRIFLHNPHQWHLIISDITKQVQMMENLAAYKQSEAARQEMEEESRLIIENSPYCIHQIDKEARIISMNPAGIKMMEASDEREILGMSYVDTVSKKDKDQVKDLLYAALSGKASEFEFLANNKHIFSSLFVPIFNNHGEVVRLLGITHDITERVQVEQNLQRSELRFRSLVEQSPFGICVFDADGTMIEMNNAAQVIGNISDEVKAGLIGQFNICTSKQARKQLSFGEEIDRAFTGEVISTLPYKIHVKKILAEIGINEKNLTDKWIISHFYPIKDANDKLINVVVFFEDVTKRKLREEKHVQQERLAAVGQLAAGIAHDFNNVMAVITLYSGLLQDSSNLSSKELQKLKIINQQAHHAADLTRQILDFSRKSILELRPLDLKLLLNEIMKFVNRTIPERIKIQFTFSEGDYMINGDPTQLQQVITNLTINARDALPHGGTLLFNLSHLRLLADETPPDADMEPGAWVILTVTDNGIGIAPETLPNIFEPFFTTKEVGKGSGLGLAQVYGIMQQHEGCITVESQLGKGTTFTIYLPALMMETAVKSVEPLSTIPQGVGETILLVEDNQSVLEAIRSILESLNYRVITAENGQEALSVYRIQPDQISLILSDVVMPKMNGFEMAKALQQESPPPKLFLMSGFPRDKKIASEIQPFVSGWLSKPLNLRQLAEALREALG